VLLEAIDKDRRYTWCDESSVYQRRVAEERRATSARCYALVVVVVVPVAVVVVR
jgi:hypothetical protein